MCPGKIWFNYPWEADKRVAYLVHANWNKQQKKSRLMRDGLWFLTEKDAQCDSAFGPFAQGCSKLCHPISYAAPGGNPTFKSCATLNKEDDAHSRRHGTRWATTNYSLAKAPNVHGLLWHPMAYASLPNCKRDLTRMAPHAKVLFDLLDRTRWTPDRLRAANATHR